MHSLRHGEPGGGNRPRSSEYAIETQNAQHSTDVRLVALTPVWRTRRGEIDHALPEYAIETQKTQNSTEVRPIALTPAWRTRREEIDHALSEYAIETQNDFFANFEFRAISRFWERWERFGRSGRAPGSAMGHMGRKYFFCNFWIFFNL